MRDLTYKIYISRHRKYLTTNKAIIQFNLLINLEYLNLLLKDIATEKNIKEKELADIELSLITLRNIIQEIRCGGLRRKSRIFY